jgi:hypothetical protein
LLVVVQVFITQRQPVDTLRKHLLDRALDPFRIAPIQEAGRQTLQQVDLAVYFAQHRRTAIAGDLASRKAYLHAARKMGCKSERFLGTLCHKKGRLRTAKTTLRQRSYAMKRRPFQVLF